MYDQRFYYPQPEDLRSDLKYKNTDKPIQMFEIIDGVIRFKQPISADKIFVKDVFPLDGVIDVHGLLRVDAIETKSHIHITSLEFAQKEIVHGDLTIKGDFNIEGNVSWSGKTKYVDSEIIRAEDNTIYLNHKGNHQTSKGGGIRLVKGINETEDCVFDIDDSGYWNVYPGLNVPVLNVETVNFEDVENGMLVAYLNGNKIGISYKKLE